MMISPETFYDERLKGKTPEQIISVIRSLKREIGRLKNIVEHPGYECTMRPSESTRISCSRLYLERAKEALLEAGGEYIPSAAERKVMEFDENIPHINKVVFAIGGYFGGYQTKTYTVIGEKIYVSTEHSLDIEPKDDYPKIEPLDKEDFLEQLESLHIGEWHKHYNTERFGYTVLDGTQWDLEIYFSNDYRPVKIYGSNAYPYNFDRLIELVEIENED